MKRCGRCGDPRHDWLAHYAPSFHERLRWRSRWRPCTVLGRKGRRRGRGRYPLVPSVCRGQPGWKSAAREGAYRPLSYPGVTSEAIMGAIWLVGESGPR